MIPHEAIVIALGRALEGQRVVFFGSNHTHARELFESAVAITPDTCTARRTNGAESITSNQGGTLHFLSANSHAVRGMSVDRAYIPCGISQEIAERIAPVVMGSKDASIYWY